MLRHGRRARHSGPHGSDRTLALVRGSVACRQRLGVVARPAHGRRATIDGRTATPAPRLGLASLDLEPVPGSQ